MTAEERKVRLRKLLNYRAHYDWRNHRGFSPYSAWAAWSDWVIAGEHWLLEGEHPWQTTTELDRSSSDT